MLGTNYSNAWAILKRRDGNLLLEFLPVGGGLDARSALDALLDVGSTSN